MIEIVREAQLPLLTALLLLAALGKAVERTPYASGAAWFARRRRLAAVSHAALEAGLGIALLLLGGVAATVPRAAAVLLFVVAAATLVQLRNRHPDAGCGCFGGLSSTPVGWRTVARAGVLAASAAATLGVPASGGVVLAHFSPWHGVVLVLEAALIGALSPELRRAFLRLRYPEPCELREVPLRRTLRRLRASSQWQVNSGLLTSSDPVDVWREGCWRLLSFPAESERTVVFAVRLAGRRPEVRAASVGLADSGEAADDADMASRP